MRSFSVCFRTIRPSYFYSPGYELSVMVYWDFESDLGLEDIHRQLIKFLEFFRRNLEGEMRILFHSYDLWMWHLDIRFFFHSVN